MRKYLHIDLAGRKLRVSELHGEAIAKAGRHLIAKALLDSGAADCHPLSPGNPLIFSAGPFAGTTFTNGNRLSVGCRSPLTGGVKEANTGGTFALAMGHQSIAGFALEGAAEDWVVLHLAGDGSVSFDSAAPYLGKGNIEVAALLHRTYGDKVSLALCGPVGEYQGLMAGVATSDRERRPSRLAARGGVGAVMGAKKVKAVVADFGHTPPLHDSKKFFQCMRTYAAKLNEQPVVKGLREVGTAGMADFLNLVGGMPVRNFRAGRLVDPATATLTVGGDHLRATILARGGDASHSCMPGCVIQCSNVWVDEAGQELVSPLEYETLGLMGTSCGLTDPDVIGRLNHAANDLGVDSIELGATMSVMMEAGLAPFGDAAFIEHCIEDLRRGTERGRQIAEGAARVGARHRVARVAAIKGQAISAYDPRVIEVTGVSMMTTAQGADHTVGNVPAAETKNKTLRDVVTLSFQAQVNAAISDSMGLCVFGRSVTDANHGLLAELVNHALGSSIEAGFFRAMGLETLRMERAFNRSAGFTEADDALPGFFLEEPLPPTGKVARLEAGPVAACLRELFEAASA